MKRKLASLLLALALLLPLLSTAGTLRAQEPGPEIYGTSLFLENNIAVNFAVDAAEFAAGGWSAPQMAFDFEGNGTVVTDYTVKDGFYYFTFRGLTPTCMAKPVTATLSAVKNGVRIAGESVSESVASYCRRAFDGTFWYDDEFLTLIADLLTYGAECQKYFGVDTGNLATKALTSNQLARKTQGLLDPVSCKDLRYAAVANPKVIWRGANLNLSDSIKLQVFFDTANTKGLSVQIRDSEEKLVAVFGEQDLVRTEEGFWRVSCDSLTPDKMFEPLFVTPYLNGTAAGDTILYSMESYAADAIASENDPALNRLLYAMLNYGASVERYALTLSLPLRRVGEPLSEIPDYTLPAGATVDQMRAMVVQAMRDQLTVQWYINDDITYTYGTQNYALHAAETYAGIPYTGGGTGLMHWLQYYDFKTGRVGGLTLNEDNNYLGGHLGNSCAAAVFWGWSSVCSSINGNSTYYMTPGRGCLPVDGYTVDPDLMSYKDYPTKRIVEDNTKERIYKAYAATLPGDGLISYKSESDSTAHARMVVSKPHVVKYASGNINPYSSYVYIQDQHKGQRVTSASSNPWSIITENGQTLHYAGHTYQKFTFSELMSEYYIPVAPAELLGERAYTVPTAAASYTGTFLHVSDLRKVTITAPYKIVTVKAMIMKDGAVVEDSKFIRISQSVNSAGLFTYALSSTNTASTAYFPLPKLPAAGGDYTLKLEVLLASGTTHTVLDVPIIVG